jgi:hypothetical protein
VDIMHADGGIFVRLVPAILREGLITSDPGYWIDFDTDGGTGRANRPRLAVMEDGNWFKRPSHILRGYLGIGTTHIMTHFNYSSERDHPCRPHDAAHSENATNPTAHATQLILQSASLRMRIPSRKDPRPTLLVAQSYLIGMPRSGMHHTTCLAFLLQHEIDTPEI